MIADSREDTLVVEHSNGWPYKVYGLLAARVALPSEYRPVASIWWTDLISRYQIAGTVAFGDWDAAEVYAELSARAPLWWLDSFACSMAPRPYEKAIGSGVTPQVKPRAYWAGVGNAQSAAYALKRCK